MTKHSPGKEHEWVDIQIAARDRGPVNLAQHHVLLLLTTWADRAGYAWPNLQTVIKASRMSRRTVISSLQALESDGWIKKLTGYRDDDTGVWIKDRRRMSFQLSLQRLQIIPTQLNLKLGAARAPIQTGLGATVAPIIKPPADHIEVSISEQQVQILHEIGANPAQPLEPLNGRTTIEPNTKSKRLSSQTAFDDSPESEPESGPKPVDFFDRWNLLCKSLPKATKFTDKRRQHVKARIKGGMTLEQFEQAVEMCTFKPFLRGDNDRGWTATFDWLTANDENAEKAINNPYGLKNGKVTNHGNSGNGIRPQGQKPDTAAVNRDAVHEAIRRDAESQGSHPDGLGSADDLHRAPGQSGPAGDLGSEPRTLFGQPVGRGSVPNRGVGKILAIASAHRRVPD